MRLNCSRIGYPAHHNSADSVAQLQAKERE